MELSTLIKGAEIGDLIVRLIAIWNADHPHVAMAKETYINAIKERIPQIKPVESDATYLMWLDCTDIASDSDELKDFICERSGLYVSSGSAYRSNGGFLRFNIACPQKMLEDGLKRLEKSVKEWKCS